MEWTASSTGLVLRQSSAFVVAAIVLHGHCRGDGRAYGIRSSARLQFHSYGWSACCDLRGDLLADAPRDLRDLTWRIQRMPDLALPSWWWPAHLNLRHQVVRRGFATVLVFFGDRCSRCRPPFGAICRRRRCPFCQRSVHRVRHTAIAAPRCWLAYGPIQTVGMMAATSGLCMPRSALAIIERSALVDDRIPR